MFKYILVLMLVVLFAGQAYGDEWVVSKEGTVWQNKQLSNGSVKVILLQTYETLFDVSAKTNESVFGNYASFTVMRWRVLNTSDTTWSGIFIACEEECDEHEVENTHKVKIQPGGWTDIPIAIKSNVVTIRLEQQEEQMQ